MTFRHIGVLAHSADGSALCFLEMVREASRRLGAHQHPEITLSILPMGPSLELYRRKDLPAVAVPHSGRVWLEQLWRAMPRLQRECRVATGVIGGNWRKNRSYFPASA